MLNALRSINPFFAAGMASIASRFPARVEALETIAGVLLIGGLAALGSVLPSLL